MDRIGRFVIESNLGQGAFGTVYRAFDPVLAREVALKVPRFAPEDGEMLRRFLREAKAAARLRHPSIVGVFESGEAGSTYYIATEFVEGEPLSDLLERERPSIETAVDWVRQLADALSYAHHEGVIHRDIKPENVMLNASGRPQLMDFGMAKRQEEDSGMTIDGCVIGTPAYMPPEQARGDIQGTGPHSDQYSLGAMLYELLTGKRPYDGPVTSIIMNVASEEFEPARPSKLSGDVPADLEACCLKAMEKLPERRYTDMNAFGDDLRRWLAGEPLQARPISELERVWRWCLRNRTVASLIALVCVLVLTGAIVATVSAVNYSNLADEERASRFRAEANLADMFTNSGLVVAEENPAQAALWFATAAVKAPNDAERERLNRLRFRNWSRSLALPLRAFAHEGAVRDIRFHPGGAHLLVNTERGPAVWDLEGEEGWTIPGDTAFDAAAWTSDGGRLALAGGGRVDVVEFPSGEPVHSLVHDGPVSALEFCAGDAFLAVGGDHTVLCDVSSDFEPHALEHPQPVARLTFSAGGDRLATACTDGRARVFDLLGPTPELLFDVPATGYSGNADAGDDENPIRPVFVDGDSGLLTYAGGRYVGWWDAETGEEVLWITAESWINSISVSPDGSRFVLGGFKFARLWDAEQGVAVGEAMPHGNFVYAAAFLGEDTLLTAGADSHVRRWSAPAGEPLTGAILHQSEVMAAVPSPDGSRLATGQGDGLVRIWGLRGEIAPIRRIAVESPDNYVEVTADGKWMIPSGWTQARDGGSARVLEVATGDTVGKQLPVGRAQNVRRIAPDGRTVLTGSSLSRTYRGIARDRLASEPGLVEFWDLESGERRFGGLATPSEPMGAAFHPDGTLAVVVCAGGEVLMIDAATGSVTRELRLNGRADPVYVVRDWVRFSPDGAGFAAWIGADARFWDDGGEQRFAFEHEPDAYVHDVRFTADGTRAVSVSGDSTARVWDVGAGEPALAPLEHPNWVFTAAFNRDGTRLLTACRDRMARLWNLETGELAAFAFQHDDEVLGVALSLDERVLLTGCRDGTVRFWEWQTGKPVVPPVTLPGQVYQVEVTSDGRHAVAAGNMRAVYVIDMANVAGASPDRGDVVSMHLLGELLAGQRVHEGGGIVNLTSEEWLQRWRRFRDENPDHGSLEVDE